MEQSVGHPLPTPSLKYSKMGWQPCLKVKVSTTNFLKWISKILFCIIYGCSHVYKLEIVMSTVLWSVSHPKYKHLITNLLSFTWRLGNGLRTLNTFSQSRDYPDYRVSIYSIFYANLFWIFNFFKTLYIEKVFFIETNDLKNDFAMPSLRFSKAFLRQQSSLTILKPGLVQGLLDYAWFQR